MQAVNTQVSCAVASSSPGTHNSTFALEAPASFPCQQHPQLPCSARGCCCTLRLSLDLVSAAEVFPPILSRVPAGNVEGEAAADPSGASLSLCWQCCRRQGWCLCQALSNVGTQRWLWQAGQGTSSTASSAAVQSCSPRMPIASLSLFSLHLPPLQSLILCLLVLGMILPEIISPLFLSLLPTLLPQEQPCP